VTSKKGRWHLLGFVALSALLVSLLWLRAGSEASLWIDEIHSLQLTQLPVPRLLDEAARDFHPPGYALALKAWIKTGRVLGLDPGTPWARSLNLVVWWLATAWAWFVGGVVLGRRRAALLTAAVSGSAAAAVAVRDLRGYGFVFSALFVAVVALSALLEGRFAGRRRLLLWAVYAAALTTALWSHLLAAPAVALLGLAWLAITGLGRRRSQRRREPGPRLATGLAAHAIPWLLFLPWLLRVPAQVAHLRSDAPSWMTPASLANLLRVFDGWLPLGRISPPTAAVGLAWTLLGALAVALPLGMGLRVLLRERAPDPAATLGRLALPPAVGSILLYWLLARLGLAATFHGPRYPMLVAGLFAAGLAGAALAGGRRPGRAAAILAPWFVVSLLGQVVAIRQEAAPGGLVAFRPQVEKLAAGLSDQGRPVLYVTPSELAPFVRRTFAGFDLRPVEEMVCSGSDRALVLDVNPWRSLDRSRDLVLARVLAPGRLAAAVTVREWRDAQTTATLFRLDGLDHALAAELCRRGLAPRNPVPGDAVAAALPGDQLSGDGWSYVELDPELRARRWATRSEVRVRFGRAVPAGSYLLHFRAHREPYPHRVEDLELKLGAARLRTEVPPGPVDLTLRVTFDHRTRPELRVRHPAWSPAEVLGTGDRRRLTFLFEAAWLTPDSPGSAAAATDRSRG
jgi:hypothetical protein